MFENIGLGDIAIAGTVVFASQTVVSVMINRISDMIKKDKVCQFHHQLEAKIDKLISFHQEEVMKKNIIDALHKYHNSIS